MKFLWGDVPYGHEEGGDNLRVRPHGSCAHSRTKKTGDGFWCPSCFDNLRKYTWIEDRLGPPCPVCGMKKKYMNMIRADEILKKH